VLLVIVTIAIGVHASNIAQRHFKQDDPGRVVIDEIVGLMTTMIGIPVVGSSLFVGFVLFRILDVTKPPPANIFDTRIKNGWGIVLDDVSAGIYANILLHLMWATKI
jgi:phosphatidylglycerophosphatase A